MTVYTTMQYQDAAKYVLESDQPYINSIIVMSRRWLATLPPDLQKIVRDDGTKVSKEIVPFVKEFFAKQHEIWRSKGGESDQAAAGRAAAMIEKVSGHRRGSVEGQAGTEQGRQDGVRGRQSEQVAGALAASLHCPMHRRRMGRAPPVGVPVDTGDATTAVWP